MQVRLFSSVPDESFVRDYSTRQAQEGRRPESNDPSRKGIHRATTPNMYPILQPDKGLASSRFPSRCSMMPMMLDDARYIRPTVQNIRHKSEHISRRVRPTRPRMVVKLLTCSGEVKRGSEACWSPGHSPNHRI
jgi:hypothetical protein